MNVLVAAAGRRTTLVAAFAKAAHARGGQVFASDVDPLAPALFQADDALRMPATPDPGYLADLLDAVGRHAIRLIVPTIDTDLPVLASNRASIEAVGCRVAVSSVDFFAVTLDKRAAGDAFRDAWIAVPRSWSIPVEQPNELPDRVFVKPRRGSASLDTYEVDRRDLATVLARVPDPIVQEVLTVPRSPSTPWSIFMAGQSITCLGVASGPWVASRSRG